MTERVDFLDLQFDPLDFAGVTDWVAARNDRSPFAYVVTPNVDHVVRLAAAPPEIVRLYSGADICVCDSRVLSRLARLVGVRLTVVPGSDLVAALFARVLRQGDRICLIGGSDEDAVRLVERFPGLHIAHHAPPMGLRDNPAARAEAVAFAARSNARIILLAVGSPQQELLAWEMREDARITGTALCIGASVDFLVGRQTRAPRIVQKAGMEWAWRLAGNPRRLARRYLIDGPAIFPMIWRWSRNRPRAAKSPS